MTTPAQALFAEADSHLAAVETLMRRLCEARPSAAGRIAAEHLSSGGKRLRARLALAALRAMGMDAARGIAWAAACELAHNATLIHDDLQDGDTLRRGQPTVWVRHGMPQAVNAGDLLLLLPVLAVAELAAPPALRWQLCDAVARRATEVIAGQAEEVALVRNGMPDRGAYRAIAVGKTSGLFMLAVEGAALLAGREAARVVGLCEAIEPLGVLFQLQDDVLDLYGDKGRGQKGGDLRAGRLSALVVEHLARRPAERGMLTSLFSEGTADAPQAAARMRESGALASVRAWILEERARVLEAAALRAEPPLLGLIGELIATVLLPIQSVLDSV